MGVGTGSEATLDNIPVLLDVDVHHTTPIRNQSELPQTIDYQSHDVVVAHRDVGARLFHEADDANFVGRWITGGDRRQSPLV